MLTHGGSVGIQRPSRGGGRPGGLLLRLGGRASRRLRRRLGIVKMLPRPGSSDLLLVRRKGGFLLLALPLELWEYQRLVRCRESRSARALPSRGFLRARHLTPFLY